MDPTRRYATRDVLRAAYVLAGAGAALFVLACLLHSKAVGLVGTVLMVMAILLGITIYRDGSVSETRRLDPAIGAF